MVEKLKFEIRGNSYETEPLNVGRVIDFMRLRSQFSGGMYGIMYREALQANDVALKMIDSKAFFTVFCPKVLEDMKPSKFEDLGLKDWKEIESLYDNTIQKWIEQVEKSLNKSEDE